MAVDQRIAGGYADAGAVGVSQGPGRLFQIGRPHVGGGSVDHVAGQRLCLCHDEGSIGINPVGCNQAGAGGVLLAVAVEAVGFEQPAERRLFECGTFEAAGDAVGAGGQPGRGRGGEETATPLRAGIAGTDKRLHDLPIGTGKCEHFAGAGGKALRLGPNLGGGGQCGKDGVAIIGADELQRDRIGRVGGKAGQHDRPVGYLGIH